MVTRNPAASRVSLLVVRNVPRLNHLVFASIPWRLPISFPSEEARLQ